MGIRRWLSSIVLTVALGASACGDDASELDAGTPGGDAGAFTDGGLQDAGTVGGCDEVTCPDGLPVQHEFDPAAAERGRAVLHEGGLAQPFIPKLAMENLWLVWGTGVLSGEAYWSQFRDRYGFQKDPALTYPLGIEDAGGGMLSMNCLTCHAGVVAGQLIIGGSNDRLDLQGLYDDLIRLNQAAPMPVMPPYTVENMTGAAGVNDAFGLGMKLSELYGGGASGINTDYGFQQAPAWWTMRFKERIYTDGSGQAEGYRTMMATMLAFGLSYAELQSYDDEFADLHQYLLSLEVPKWPFDPPQSGALQRGREVFESSCAQCHGSYGNPEAYYPNRLVPFAEVGTDPVRAANFGELEEAWINASWFGQVSMDSTRAYLAPVLVGVWATAPYFHNGSVPDLMSVLDPGMRPQQWKRTGSDREHYDAVRVGWKYETAGPTDGSTIEGRRVYDTTRPGLSNQGHDYGADLTEAERTDLVEYLKTL